jgi:DMSO/TMAO reductase YedYZ molybdopterin-dependent catalytic subunit
MVRMGEARGRLDPACENSEPVRRLRWRSPIRGPWLASVFGVVLLVGIPIEFVTGLVSYAAYNPRLSPNDPNPQHGALGFYLFNWPTRPSWLYQVNEGTHLILGYVLVPVLLAKLWSVVPRLFAQPIARSAAHLLERLGIVLLVGGAVFQFSTGILYVDYFNAFRFPFETGHFYGAWVFMIGFALHVGLKLPAMVRALRSRRLRTELATPLSQTRPETIDSGLVASDPAPPTISRRGALGLVFGTSVAVFLLTVGESIGGWTRRFALFGTRDRGTGVGANDFPVNHTAEFAGVTAAMTGAGWRLELIGPQRVTLSRQQLLAMPQTTARLPIACTEGWSTVQRWTGVPLADLARLTGAIRVASAEMESLQGGDIVTLSGAQVQTRQSLLALRVNDADLSLDHGFPARVIVPSAPGSYNRKWLGRLTFHEQA